MGGIITEGGRAAVIELLPFVTPGPKLVQGARSAASEKRGEIRIVSDTLRRKTRILANTSVDGTLAP